MDHKRIFGIILAAILGCNTQQSAERESEHEVETPAPVDPADPADPASSAGEAREEQVTLQVLSYNELQDLIASHRGKVVVMDAWSTSCPPCIKEFPNLVKLQQEVGPEKLAAISLSFDNEGVDDLESVKERVLGFLEQQDATFDNVISKEETDDLYKKFDLAAVPSIFVYGPNGRLHKRFDNEKGEHFTYEDVGALVNELLSEAAKIQTPDGESE